MFFGLPQTPCLTLHTLQNFWQWHHLKLPGETTPSAVLVAALCLATQKRPPDLLSPLLRQLTGSMEWLQHQGLCLGLLEFTAVSCTSGTLIPVRHHSRTVVFALPGHINPVSDGCMMGTVVQARSVWLVEGGAQYIVTHDLQWLK